MSYWHIQMYQPWGRNNGTINSREMLELPQPIIGTGEWDDIQCYRFKGLDNNSLKKGDLVLVREGSTVIALCKISGDSFVDSNLQAKYYHTNYRNVKVLGFYTGGLPFPQPQGTLERLVNKTKSLDFVNNFYHTILKKQQMNNATELLKYKNQIILQGPPGTGKTRLAKEIAQELTALELRNIVEVKHLIKYLIPGIVIQTPTNYNTFSIVRVEKDKVFVYPKKAENQYSVSFKDIINCAKDYQNEDQVTKYNQNGVGSYLVGLANYVVNELAKEQYKIIQFHPAYSYEDFVRGIVIDGEGEKLKYETKNKILGEFAQIALRNFEDSNKESSTISYEKWLEERLTDFKERVEEIAENEEKGYVLTDNVSIYPSEDLDAFRYKGAKWATESMHRLRFSDIKLLYNNKVNSRKAVDDVAGISGSAIQHKTYYFNLLQKFREYLETQPKFESKDVKIQQLNYVLIIDEINRANLPAVLGELIYALEYRGEKVQGMYSINKDYDLVLPKNLFIIGTMNTADRSVGHIDYAIRRRFAFVDVLPRIDVIKLVEAKLLFIKVSSLFIKNDLTSFKEDSILIRSEHLAEEFLPEDIWLGHSYFLAKDVLEMKVKLKYEIIPILKEYIKDGVLKESAKDIIDTLLL